ncbi:MULTISPECIES: hypothetical protein [unclassified Pseudomonas]|uniref:hypothetical protein n=1 Tax=unclassified Pseudomonas TaxID=196821 RepID=UPI000270C372|nr:MULTISPECIES: hypothetical protein [unclassified Pseudomonas]EJM92448.1 hypothetical protein PMI33_00705 [Pseudomonas sp. GM67]
MSKHVSKIMYASEIFKPSSLDGHFGGGFNSRVQGVEFCVATDGAYKAERMQGWWRADEMINTGKIYFVHPFPHGQCKFTGFVYGGTWACNGCNTDGFQKPWWAVRVMKDGAAWCVVGEGFQDLQTSDNYAYGDTREEALKAYAQLMTQSVAA